jgi:uncharacterized protein (DUF362 family)
MDRRAFLRLAAAGLGGLAMQQFLAACGGQPEPQAPRTTAPTGAPADPPAASPAPHPDAPDLVVARRGEPQALVEAALTALGGIERFVPKGARVIIKPNICVAYHTYEYAATTNPWVVGALVHLCVQAGARSVQVMDKPFGGGPEKAYARSGIEEQVKAAGGEMVVMSHLKYPLTAIPAGLDIHEWEIYQDALEADVLINVPIAKHHELAGLTLGMKNLMGLVLKRSNLHINLGQRLADLTSLFRPALTVVDAVRVLRDHGPTGGDLNDVEQLDTLIASPDIVAADSYAATLFGRAPADLAYIQAGTQMGLGRSDLERLKIEEINLSA